MADDGFGSELWKNLQSIKLGRDGGIEAPVRANGVDGIVVGAEAVAKTESPAPPDDADSRPLTRPTRWWTRLLRR